MFIPYESIGNFIEKFYKNDKLKSFFYDKKVSQNVNYIQKNKQNVLKKLKNKLIKNQKINILFYVYDETKWKCQSIYDIFEKDKRFHPVVIATKSAAKNKDNPTYQTKENVSKTFEYFKQRGYRTELGYDIEQEKFIPFKDFEPDIIFYQHPWYVETSQGPVVCSKYALTAYIPYYFQIEVEGHDDGVDYHLRFHQYIENYYVQDDFIENKIKQKIQNKKVNVKSVGYPYLDYFYNNNDAKGEYVIYAPHWAIKDIGFKYGTFEWSGQYMLNYAKGHPEIKWLFKPHPILFKTLVDTGLYTTQEAEQYYEDWKKIGTLYEGGDYLEKFNQSKLMITDSASFLGEYFVSKKPIIWLLSQNSHYKSKKNYLLKTLYCAENTNELENLLKDVLNDDYMKEARIEALKTSGLNNNASEKIFEDIMSQIESY